MNQQQAFRTHGEEVAARDAYVRALKAIAASNREHQAELRNLREQSRDVDPDLFLWRKLLGAKS